MHRIYLSICIVYLSLSISLSLSPSTCQDSDTDLDWGLPVLYKYQYPTPSDDDPYSKRVPWPSRRADGVDWVGWGCVGGRVEGEEGGGGGVCVFG
jgi:hypothetical protein